MGQLPFDAKEWLTSRSRASNSLNFHRDQAMGDRPASKLEFHDQDGFNPSHFLTTGWTGEELRSKESHQLVRILEEIEEDVLCQFRPDVHFNKTLKLSIYSEFLSFIDNRAINCTHLDTPQNFWDHLFSTNSPYRNELSTFTKIYAHRVATLYLFKIRFLATLCEVSGYTITSKNLLNPNSFFAQVFKQGSSNELPSESLRSNQYTWYRPGPGVKSQVLKISKKLPGISISDFLSITHRRECRWYNTEEQASFSFSHSLSHMSFGRLLHTLTVKVPKWMQGDHQENSGSGFLKTLNCKFLGNHLPSVSLAHWAAQEQSLGKKWGQIICPDFDDNDFSSGKYLKYCFEIQFLTFLTTIATKQGYSPLSFIARVQKEKNGETIGANTQMSIFQTEKVNQAPLYDNIIINLQYFPKNNPHFYLLSKIHSQYKDLKRGGNLTILSSKKLFVPSQSERVEQLLKKFKLECAFTFDNLKGKGELNSYVYILKKRVPGEGDELPFHLNSFESQYLSKTNKLPCYSFRVSGDLGTFQNFGIIVNELNKFCKVKKIEETQIYQTELDGGFNFEFYQDAIVDGKLINSSKDPSKITHPKFFKNLLSSCVTFDEFFTVGQLNQPSEQEKQDSNQSLLGIRNNQEQFPYLLIVDFRNPYFINLEIANYSAYEGKSQEYGFALCHYFGLTPKRRDINLNLFRKYFSSDIGKQVIQLSLSGKISKLKSKINTTLVPKFFLDTFKIPEHLSSLVSLFSTKEEQILKAHPQQLKAAFFNLSSNIDNLYQEYPWHTLSLMTYFTHSLGSVIDKVKDPHLIDKISYYNPIISNALVKIETQPLFPDHNDVYIEFDEKCTKADIQRPFSFSRIVSEAETQSQRYFVELMSGEKTIVRLYTKQSMAGFIQFILQGANGLPISQILQSLQIPKVSELERVIEHYENLVDSLSDLEKSIEKKINSLLRLYISNHGETLQ